MTNIYRKLNAPYVYSDGSVDVDTKIWATRQLGFVDTDEYRFESWIELSDYSYVIPHYLIDIKQNIKYRLEITNGGFSIICAFFDTEVVCTNSFTPQEIDVALDKARELIDKIIDWIPESQSLNLHDDSRYEFKFQDEEDELGSYYYNNTPVSLVNVVIPGNPSRFIAKSKITGEYI